MEKFLNKLEVSVSLERLLQVLRIFGLVSLSFFNKNK